MCLVSVHTRFTSLSFPSESQISSIIWVVSKMFFVCRFFFSPSVAVCWIEWCEIVTHTRENNGGKNALVSSVLSLNGSVKEIRGKRHAALQSRHIQAAPIWFLYLSCFMDKVFFFVVVVVTCCDRPGYTSHFKRSHRLFLTTWFVFLFFWRLLSFAFYLSTSSPFYTCSIFPISKWFNSMHGMSSLPRWGLAVF